MSASASRSSAACSAPSSRPATDWSSAYENPRPSTAPICAISRAGAEPVEPRGERLLQGRRDRLRAALFAALQQEARNLLDEQRDAAGALAHPFDDVPWQRMTGREFADHLRRPATRSSGDSEITLWCDRTLQGGRNSGRAVAMMSNGACAPRSASARMRSSEVGSAQCRSSKASTTACVRAAARIHAVIAASCRRRNSSGASFADAVLWQRGHRPAARAGARIRLGPGRSDRSVFSRSARRCSAGRSAPKRWRPHSAIGCSGVFCNSCDDDHSTQVCGVSPRRP